MSRLKSVLVTSALMAGVALSATAASADVACNRWGECWHVQDRMAYPGELGIVWHPDHWRAGHHYHFRQDHPGHGYYRNGAWVAF